MPGPIGHEDLTLLRVESAAVLEEIHALVDLSGFVVGTLDERTVIIDPARTGALAEQLAAAGLAPLVRKLRPGMLTATAR